MSAVAACVSACAVIIQNKNNTSCSCNFPWPASDPTEERNKRIKLAESQKLHMSIDDLVKMLDD